MSFRHLSVVKSNFNRNSLISYHIRYSLILH